MKKPHINTKYFLIIAMAIFLICCTALSVYIYKKHSIPLAFLASLSDEEQISVGRFIGDAYQNIYGYATVCKTEDIAMKKYPDAYKKASEANLSLLNKILEKDDLNFEASILLFLTYDDLQAINQELRSLSDSDDKGIKSACLLLEEQAELIASGIAKISEHNFGKILRGILR